MTPILVRGSGSSSTWCRPEPASSPSWALVCLEETVHLGVGAGARGKRAGQRDAACERQQQLQSQEKVAGERQSYSGLDKGPGPWGQGQKKSFNE